MHVGSHWQLLAAIAFTTTINDHHSLHQPAPINHLTHRIITPHPYGALYGIDELSSQSNPSAYVVIVSADPSQS
jgi:hypothetical protein